MELAVVGRVHVLVPSSNSGIVLDELGGSNAIDLDDGRCGVGVGKHILCDVLENNSHFVFSQTI